jgi:NADH:ubiquinone oxidoreductase subunit 3 (subunit A)
MDETTLNTFRFHDAHDLLAFAILCVVCALTMYLWGRTLRPLYTVAHPTTPFDAHVDPLPTASSQFRLQCILLDVFFLALTLCLPVLAYRGYLYLAH